jgi:hypothetical protein
VRRFIVTAVLLGLCSPLLAQQLPPRSDSRRDREDKKNEKRQRINEILKHEEEGEPSYQSHSVWGFKLNHDGYGISYEIGKMKSPYKATLLQFELNEKKHAKEEKQSTGSSLSGGFIVLGNPFVYGKINHFYQLKGAYGQQIMIGNKGNKNGVAVYGIYSGGLSLGLLRPYYIDVQAPPGRTQTIKYSPKDSAAFLGPYIVGGTGIATGWSDVSIAPGLHGKAALRFDWNRFNNALSAIEFGFNFEYYPKKIEQMARVEGRNMFINGYLSLVFGRRK